MATKKVNVKIQVDNSKATSRLGKFKKALLSIKGVIGAGIGLAVLNKGLKETVGRAISAETGLKRLGVAMQSAARFSDENLQAFERMSVNLERTTGFMEEDVLQAMAVLQTFGQMTRADMEKTIVASLNMATVFNEDLTQAAIRLGKAYNGQLIGLQRMGVGISKAKFNAEGFSAVLNQLQKEQGGQATARMLGFEGSINRIKVAFGEVGKEAGKFVTKSQGLRTVIDSLSGGLTKWANLLRKTRIATGHQSEAVRILTEDLNDQKKALASVGKEIRNNVLIQLKEELILLQERIDIEEKTNKNQEERIAVNKKLGIQADELSMQEIKLQKLRGARKKLEDDIVKLESDRHVQGSKANRDQIDAELKIIKLVKEEEAEVKRLNAVWEKNFQGADQVKAAYEGVAEAQEKRRKRAKDTADAEKEALEEAKKVADELEELEIFRLDKFFQRLKIRADAIKATNQERLNAAIEVANKEIAANERLQQTLLDIRTGKVKKALQDELLSEVERSLLLDEQEAKAQALYDAILSGSKGSAVELEKNIAKLERQNELLKDVEGADFIKNILAEAGEEAENLIDTLGRATLSPKIDPVQLKEQMKTAGEKAADEFKRSFEQRLKSAPIQVPNITLTPPSFGAGSDN